MSSTIPANGQPPSLMSLLWSSFLIGMFSFGGGVVEWILREVVYRRKWLPERDVMVDLAITRVLPGTNVANMMVLVGYRLMGLAGAATALVGLIAAPFGIVLAAVYFYDQLSGPLLDATMEGAAAGALGLLVLTTYRSFRHSLRGWHSALVIGLVFAGIFVFNAPFVPLIVSALVISLFLAFWQSRSSAR